MGRGCGDTSQNASSRSTALRPRKPQRRWNERCCFDARSPCQTRQQPANCCAAWVYRLGSPRDFPAPVIARACQAGWQTVPAAVGTEAAAAAKRCARNAEAPLTCHGFGSSNLSALRDLVVRLPSAMSQRHLSSPETKGNFSPHLDTFKSG